MKKLKTIIITNLEDKPYISFFTEDCEILRMDYSYEVNPTQNGMMVINIQQSLMI